MDPVTLINKGVQRYDVTKEKRPTYHNSKLPVIPIQQPDLEPIMYNQCTGPLIFDDNPNRQKASCTRAQMDVMPDRIASSWQPFCAPYVAQSPGDNTRWIYKDKQC